MAAIEIRVASDRDSVSLTGDQSEDHSIQPDAETDQTVTPDHKTIKPGVESRSATIVANSRYFYTL